jgi:hypothetical protein
MAAQFFGYAGSRCLSTRQTNQTVDLFVSPLFWPVHCYREQILEAVWR